MQRRTLAKEADRLYLDSDEYQLLLDEFVPALEQHYEKAKYHQRFQIATRMMCESGFRSDGIDDLRIGEFYKPFSDDVDIWFVPVVGKDSKARDTEGKYGDVWINQDLKEEIDDHLDRNRIKPGQQLFTFSYDQLRDRFIVVGDHLADLTGNDNWRHLRPHDCRARFVCWMDEKGVSDEIAMWLGRWDSEDAYKRYKRAIQAKEIQTELALADVLETDVDVSIKEMPREHRILHQLDELTTKVDRLTEQVGALEAQSD